MVRAKSTLDRRISALLLTGRTSWEHRGAGLGGLTADPEQTRLASRLHENASGGGRQGRRAPGGLLDEPRPSADRNAARLWRPTRRRIDTTRPGKHTGANSSGRLVNGLGINRVRIEIRSGAANPVDYWTLFREEKIGYRDYQKINDNDDPGAGTAPRPTRSRSFWNRRTPPTGAVADRWGDGRGGTEARRSRHVFCGSHATRDCARIFAKAR